MKRNLAREYREAAEGHQREAERLRKLMAEGRRNLEGQYAGALHYAKVYRERGREQ